MLPSAGDSPPGAIGAGWGWEERGVSLAGGTTDDQATSSCGLRERQGPRGRSPNRFPSGLCCRAVAAPPEEGSSLQGWQGFPPHPGGLCCDPPVRPPEAPNRLPPCLPLHFRHTGPAGPRPHGGALARPPGPVQSLAWSQIPRQVSACPAAQSAGHGQFTTTRGPPATCCRRDGEGAREVRGTLDPPERRS